MPIYNIEDEKLTPIRKVKFKNERELQRLTENNLEELFGLKFVATEFQVDNLRIDTLAFNEETNSFVIIEYKNVKNYSVIDQGYSYLSLLLNNKAEFVLKYNLVFNTALSKEEFDAIYESEDYHSICIPYKSEYLYGTPEMQATYFEKHPIP